MCNRATMRDERIHPVSRQIAKLHVLEEARHVSFAKTYLAELWPRSRPRNETPPRTSHPSQSRSLPDSWSTITSTRRSTSRTAPTPRARTPITAARIVADLAKLTGFLTELGVIDEHNRPEWVERGLAV